VRWDGGVAGSGVMKVLERCRQGKRCGSTSRPYHGRMTKSILDLIVRKRDGHELSEDEIRRFVSGVVSATAADYQIGAMLMAIYLRGMTDLETAHLTTAMVQSGDVIDLRSIRGFKADKHSTGGVGDKVTLMLGPLVASAGVYFPKLSGRGLGHTGGTLDKLESIRGLRVDLSLDEFVRQVKEVGLAISGQTGELVPADGILYSLRDVTGTIDSIPLIASSVMSKKIAAGDDGIVLDVKCGRGAFMQTGEDALALARLMVTIGKASGKRVAAFVTSMEEPLGFAVGNALEVREAVSTLRGSDRAAAPQDLREVCLVLGGHILVMAGICSSVEAGRLMLEERIGSGAAFAKLREMVEWQGGDVRMVDDTKLLPTAAEILQVVSPQSGFVQGIDARKVGEAVMELGAGRKAKVDPVDHAVGCVFCVQVGDPVERNQLLAEIHTNHRIPNEDARLLLMEAIEIGDSPPVRGPHVMEIVTSDEL
jgi:pyrimidine-nucleoside phosphorylase